jgi:hypothetical protein
MTRALISAATFVFIALGAISIFGALTLMLLGTVCLGVYLLHRSGMLTVSLLGLALYVGVAYFPDSDFIVGLKCGGLPNPAVCAQLARQGWTRGWIQQAYGARFIGGDYVYTRTSPDLIVRGRYQPTGNVVDDFLASRGGIIL